jgi:hypothetical protein
MMVAHRGGTFSRLPHEPKPKMPTDPETALQHLLMARIVNDGPSAPRPDPDAALERLRANLAGRSTDLRQLNHPTHD